MSSSSNSLSTTAVLLNGQQTARERGAELARLRLFALLLVPAVLSVLPIIIWGLPNGPDFASHLRFAQA
ncbi:MAG TPA: hypothetical protein VE961_16500, partial [Pyrinomonadaceae bacterium]|nr:hypothetical protein [Pyrinomonadaceae bacterium]